MTAPADPRPHLAAAFAQAQRLLDQVQPDDLARPTPCEDFDVALLTAHLVGVAGRFGHIGRGGFFADAPAMVTDIEPADRPQAFAARAAVAMEVWADDELLARTFTVPWGDVPGVAVVGGYVQELTVHSWDLAQGLGVTDLDPALAAVCLPIARVILPPEIRGDDDVPFGPVVEVGDDADPYEQLAGWLGRRPLLAA